MTPNSVRSLYALLAVGIAVHAVNAVAGHGSAPLDGGVASWAYTLVEFAGAFLCLAAVPRHHRERGAWALIGLGLLLWAAGDLVWTLWLNNLDEPPYPNLADALYLGSYASIYPGILLLLRARCARSAPRSGWTAWSAAWPPPRSSPRSSSPPSPA